jgi:hypothetical protein
MRIQNVKYWRALLHARCWREIAAGDFYDNVDEFFGFINVRKTSILLECDVIYVRRHYSTSYYFLLQVNHTVQLQYYQQDKLYSRIPKYFGLSVNFGDNISYGMAQMLTGDEASFTVRGACLL